MWNSKNTYNICKKNIDQNWYIMEDDFITSLMHTTIFSKCQYVNKS